MNCVAYKYSVYWFVLFFLDTNSSSPITDDDIEFEILE